MRLLEDAGISFDYNVYYCCRALGGTFRFVDFRIFINSGVIYLEIGEPVLLAPALVQPNSLTLQWLPMQMNTDIVGILLETSATEWSRFIRSRYRQTHGLRCSSDTIRTPSTSTG